MSPKMGKEKSFTITYADILIYANFCQLLPMWPKMEKEKLFTIIYADILIFANFCQLMPIFAVLCQFWPMPMLPKIVNMGKNEAAPPP